MFFEESPKGIILRVRLTPNSSSCKISGIFSAPDGDYLKIHVISVPEKGKANQELIKLLSKKFKLAKSAFSIISGELDRYKKILILADTEQLKSALSQLDFKE